MNIFNVDLNPNYGAQCIDKDSCKDDLKRSYISPGHPIAFSGINAVYKYYNPHLTIKDIETVLSEIENYTLHREFHSNQRNPSYSHYKRYQWQCDLVDIRNLSKENDGVNYLLVCIDTFTRYAFIRPIVNKTGPEVRNAFQSILAEAGSPPKILVMDRGTEFYNRYFVKMCADNSIKMYSPDSSIHAAYVERFNRTMQGMLYKYLTENETRRYLEVLPTLLQSYNNRVHRMIGTTPAIAEGNSEVHLEMRKRMSDYYSKIKPKMPKFQVGDFVRIVKLKGKFDRGYNERAAREIFKIHEVKTNLKIPMYVLSNYNGDEIIKGRFYQNELTKASGDVFRVETVIRRRKYRGRNQLYVKWKGFDATHNSWIDEDQVTRVF